MSGWLRRLALAIPILWVAVAHLGPLFAMARVSMMDVYPGPPGRQPAFSLAAYAALLDGPGYRASLLLSLWWAGLATLAALLLAYPLAYHVAVHVPRSRRVRRLLLLVAPFWAGEVVRMFALVLLLANRGALNECLQWLGLTAGPVRLLYGTGAVLAGLVYTVFLSAVLPLYAALDRLPPDVLQAASDLGAGAWARLRYVTLPLTAGGIASAAMLTYLACLGILAAPALLGGAGIPVFAVTIAAAFGDASGRWPVGTAFGFILLLVGTACAAALALPARRRAVTN